MVALAFFHFRQGAFGDYRYDYSIRTVLAI